MCNLDIRLNVLIFTDFTGDMFKNVALQLWKESQLNGQKFSQLLFQG
jgi:hypothetical protein